MGKNWVLNSIIAVLILIFLSISGVVALITDFLWFKSLGFSKIFIISLKTKIIVFLIAAIVFFLFLIINLLISSKLTSKNIVPFKLKVMFAIVVSFIAGSIASTSWFMVLQYFNQHSFNIADPILGKDAAFYVFTLPFLSAIWTFLIMCVVVTIIMVTLDYLQTALLSMRRPNFEQNPPVPNTFDIKSLFLELKRNATVHLAILAAIGFGLVAVKHYLARFSIMYSEKGIVVGAGYVDVIAYLPIVKILSILAVIVAIMFFIWIYTSKNPKLKKRHILMYTIFLYLLFGFVGTIVIPNVVQTLKVSPNEINLEQPYIENNIKFTRIAYGLSDVEEQNFSVEMSLTSKILDEAPETIDNIRILDWRPLTQTYKQTQEIRLYYDLKGIDIDRYSIDGKLTQVMLAPRELDQNQITENAKTWVNLHMVYTHGFGIVMSPVNKVTKEGLPYYYIQDIPPQYTIDEESIIVNRPQIYYGEVDNDFVLVNTAAKEFDYPKGNTNEYINYNGTGGIKLNSFLKKLLMAIRFKDIKLLLSSDISSESKIMFKRSIQERISTITPFLGLDQDPYLVVDNGNLVWIQDAYTFTGNFPYSDKYKGLNYIRNSVKIVMDAYDGDVTYYVTDTEDPIIMTYAKIFPKQFKSIDDMPDSLKKHIRYPEDLFKIQLEIYSTYHMENVNVFYNKEDAWQIPYEIYGVGQQISVEPYYIIMKLPEQEKEEFVLMSTFTPIKKNNMIAWMAARSDGDNYGKLILYKFPKDKLIYGPLQIEAKIDQDSEISQQLTLWSQQGSKVTRGNLLVIPINNSLLYIEPLYIQAETGQLPELKRVLVSDGESVIMENDLETALRVLFGEYKKETVDSNDEELLKSANDYYNLILEGMNKQNWTAIGENFDKLGEVLAAME